MCSRAAGAGDMAGSDVWYARDCHGPEAGSAGMSPLVDRGACRSRLGVLAGAANAFRKDLRPLLGAVRVQEVMRVC